MPAIAVCFNVIYFQEMKRLGQSTLSNPETLWLKLFVTEYYQDTRFSFSLNVYSLNLTTMSHYYLIIHRYNSHRNHKCTIKHVRYTNWHTFDLISSDSTHAKYPLLISSVIKTAQQHYYYRGDSSTNWIILITPARIINWKQNVGA